MTSTLLRSSAILDRYLPPDLVREPLQSITRVGKLVRGKRWRVVREMPRKLNHLIEQLAKRDILTSLAG